MEFKIIRMKHTKVMDYKKKNARQSHLAADIE